MDRFDSNGKEAISTGFVGTTEDLLLNGRLNRDGSIPRSDPRDFWFTNDVGVIENGVMGFAPRSQAPELPVVELPAEVPPVVEPPVAEPPVVEPPFVEPPVAEPPISDPPVADPPIVEPPIQVQPHEDPNEVAQIVYVPEIFEIDLIICGVGDWSHLIAMNQPISIIENQSGNITFTDQATTGHIADGADFDAQADVVVPEPNMVALLGVGLLTVVASWRRRGGDCARA